MNKSKNKISLRSRNNFLYKILECNIIILRSKSIYKQINIFIKYILLIIKK